ncbi:MAG: replication protein RepB, partial [Prevotella pallens]|nr:replication protein RepB [Prevotella pallens]
QIYRAKNKMDAQLEQMNEMQRRQFQQMLIQYFDFTQPNAKSMAERITAELYPLAMQKLMDLRQRFNTIYVKDKAAYTFKSLDQMIREHDIPNTTVEEIKE